MSTKRMFGREAVAKSIKASGVDHFFYVEGAMATLFPAIDTEGVRTVLCRTEKAATGMADGYARVTGRPTICYGQHGVAAAILAALMYEPMYAHSPVIALTASVPTLEKDQWRYQECYEMSYFEPTCKFNVDITDAERLPEYIRTAVQIAVSGCPGPTHVNIHYDMANCEYDFPEIYGDSKFFSVPPFRPKAESSKISEAAQLLIRAERPVMICGTGVHISGAYEEVRQLAELLEVPVATNYGGKGSFPENHPLSIGVMGSYGRELTNDLIRESDLVFFVGTRAGRHMTEDLTAPAPGKSAIIHLEISPEVIGRVYKADVPLVGDAKVTLAELVAVLRGLMKKSASREERVRRIALRIREYESSLAGKVESDEVPIKPQRLMSEVAKVMREKDLIVSDTGQMICWTTRFLKTKLPGLTYLPCGGSLGSSLPLAIGASFAANDRRRVLNLIGDGGMGYNISEFETAKRYNDEHAPLVVVVNNNSSFAQGRPKVMDWKNKDGWVSCADFGEIDFAKVAEGFGCYGVKVERPSEISEAIESAFRSGVPALVDVRTDRNEYAPIGTDRIYKKEAYPGIPSY